MPRFYPPPCSYCHTSAETRRKSFMSKCPTVQFFGPCFLGWFGLLRSNVCERNSATIPQCIGQKVKQHWYKNTAQTFKTVAYNQGATVDQLCSRWEPFPLIFFLDILRCCYNPSSLKIQHLKPAHHLFLKSKIDFKSPFSGSMLVFQECIYRLSSSKSDTNTHSHLGTHCTKCSQLRQEERVVRQQAAGHGRRVALKVGLCWIRYPHIISSEVPGVVGLSIDTEQDG